ncbi:hypothetical protein CfE428DRAFT_3749 [Chthoniobacter flavus Ellin428]|uniref:Uncharacterized protein n=1 Tax=Chthoniobacter flavus Ellin428 TaxID=497964 RepID=B4D4B1_9BACT|nr:hypothetical protein [Chthoniobacter flavus]EDY18712.1 hypothetical protein CfE428DRAFT_3749 [Chthoniobacter flavus Ellin428]TCO89048.1 hypothetical protein EV701_11582 [Chthoniobacter flavus]
MNAQFQLLFHADHLKFALIRELDDWRREFDKFREALSFAKSEGAIELPFLVLDEGDLYSESIVTVEPKNRNPMIHDSDELAAFIGRTLHTRDSCRVFFDVLQRCWDMPPPRQEKAVKAFANEHGWEAKIHEPGAYGIVADFTSASS